MTNSIKMAQMVGEGVSHYHADTLPQMLKAFTIPGSLAAFAAACEEASARSREKNIQGAAVAQRAVAAIARGYIAEFGVGG